MYSFDKSTKKDSKQDDNYLGIDEEYEEISGLESPHPFEIHNSVHFVLDERTTLHEVQDDVSEQPVVRTSALLVPSIETENTDSNTARLSVTDRLCTVEAYDTEADRSDSSDDEDFNPASTTGSYVPTFEEETGGLCPNAAADTKNTLFFRDGKRRIDLVLVYEEEDVTKGVLNEVESLRIDYRRNFQKSLENEGLELEVEPKESSYDQQTCFIKINCPYQVLQKYATIMHIQRPVKEGKEEISFEKEALCYPLFRQFYINDPLVEDDTTLATSVFSQNNEDKLILKERQRFYTSAQRSQIVWQILLRARFADENNIGIRKLLKNRSYEAAFPLHEGGCSINKQIGCDYIYDRQILAEVWAGPLTWYKYQPLWLVRKYFGDKIALYFAWLGFYTNMLILPSIVGLICFIYGLSTMDSPENMPSREICNPNVAGNITLCPLCDNGCKYQKLKDSCLFSNVTYLFDNTSTVFFSIFMSFWATSFLEFWKRKQALISWQWDLHTGIEDEDTRPEYDTSATTYKINPVTRRKEPFVPSWRKAMQMCVSVVVVTFMILVVFLTTLLTIVLRLVMFTMVSDSNYTYMKTHAKLITTVWAAIINLLIIVILNKFYHYIALWLTNEENPRTHMQYERSFIVKIFLFEFMNYYSSLMYIAFFKGRFFTHPGDTDSRNSMLLRLRGDVCDPAGCLSELCIQLAIIMIGKQFLSNVLELLFPAIRNWWRNRLISKHKKEKKKELSHWEENYAMQDPGKLALFEEYLEMVIQYGFVTLFVAAFPLAPLFALLNNICEIRLDAYKMIAQARRPIAERVENIGAWFWILRVITYLAVISNAFVIAYTSDYIPRKVYQLFYSENKDLIGYIDSSLSVFNTSDFPTNHNKLSKGIEIDPDTCQYRGYRNGPDHEDPYSLSVQYWIIFGARLLFVVVFEHVVFSVTAIIANTIPNVPYQVDRQIALEKQLLKENKYQNPNNVGNSGKPRKHHMDSYDQFLSEIRKAHDDNERGLRDVVNKTSWVRRISRRISSHSLSTKLSLSTFTNRSNESTS